MIIMYLVISTHEIDVIFTVEILIRKLFLNLFFGLCYVYNGWLINETYTYDKHISGLISSANLEPLVCAEV